MNRPSSKTKQPMKGLALGKRLYDVEQASSDMKP